MNLSEVLDQLAEDLNDAEPGYEYTHWSREQLRAYIAEGMQTIFAERPDLFMETKIIKVQPCTTFQDLCGCDKIYKVLGQSTEKGRILYQLRKRSSNQRLVWQGKPCPRDPRSFRLREYDLDKATNTLELYPAVPPGVDIWIAVQCSERPRDFADDADIADELIPFVMQWALFRAHAVDGEVSQVAFTLSRAHEQAFWRLVSAQWRRQQKEEEKADE